MSSTYQEPTMSRTIVSFPLIRAAAASLTIAAAFMPIAAQAQAPAEMRAEAMLLLRACSADYDRLCSDVTPGGGRILRANDAARAVAAGSRHHRWRHAEIGGCHER
jgi:hypothetical protein